jgi:hypothetical protein
MRDHVFISYSSKDQAIADEICKALETAKVRCWIAHRDNEPGLPYAAGIQNAIGTAAAVVLVFTDNSNNSQHVLREVDSGNALPMFVIRVANVQPVPELAYFLKSIHWIDAFDGAFDRSLKILVKAVKRRLTDMGVRPYIIRRGIVPMQDFARKPDGTIDKSIAGIESVEGLRAKLIEDHIELPHPIEITVTGTLFPCALLSSGWWERRADTKIKRLDWRDGTQEWLFHGFDLWGPSWDFTWDFDNWKRGKKRPYFIAQLGDGDEANSIPVLLPETKALKIRDALQDTKRGQTRRVLQAKVSCLLGHRRHFAKHVDRHALELFGGLLDYCLWVDGNSKKHEVVITQERTEMYSGYLWKCLAPKEALSDGILTLTDVYFVWDHANLTNKDAVSYSLDALEAKENYVRKLAGGQELVLIQKSSDLVPGAPMLSADSIYDMLLGKSGFKI